MVIWHNKRPCFWSIAVMTISIVLCNIFSKNNLTDDHFKWTMIVQFLIHIYIHEFGDCHLHSPMDTFCVIGAISFRWKTPISGINSCKGTRISEPQYCDYSSCILCRFCCQIQNKCQITVPLTNCRGISEKLNGVFHRHGANVYDKPQDTIRNLLVKP